MTRRLSVLPFLLRTLAVLACGAGAFAQDLHKDERLGFQLRIPRGWKEIPLRTDESALKSLTLEYVEGEEMLEAFRKELGLKKDSDLHALQTAWHEYVQSELKVTSSRGLARAARMATRHGREHRVRRLYEEAIAAGEADALTHHHYAELLQEMKEPEGAREHWAMAVELDPLVSDYYIEWGKSLLEDAALKAEGKRLLKLAREIEPENFYLEHNLERLLAK